MIQRVVFDPLLHLLEFMKIFTSSSWCVTLPGIAYGIYIYKTYDDAYNYSNTCIVFLGYYCTEFMGFKNTSVTMFW